MAGKTLLGIGNGARDGARSSGDASGTLPRGDSSSSAGGAPTSLATMSSGPTLVDDEKVKEGLRRLRSLDSSSQSRAGIDPLAATVARALEPLPGDGARVAPNGAGPAALPASAVRSLDDLVPLAEGGSGPHAAPSTALVRRPDLSERGTLLGRDLHLPPEFGAAARERERSLTPPRPAPRPPGQPPRLPAGVKPPIPRPSRPTARRKLDETVQVRSRPNLAARIVIVLTTAAAVALLGVAGIRWHREDEIQNNYPRQPPREWPSSETLPTRAAAPAMAPQREPAARSNGTGASPEATLPRPSAQREAALAPPAPPTKELRGEDEDRREDRGLESDRGSPLVDPRLEPSRRHRRRERQPATTGEPTSAVLPSVAAVASQPATVAPPSFNAAGGAPAAGSAKPTKAKGGKDDPDSTLPLDLE